MNFCANKPVCCAAIIAGAVGLIAGTVISGDKHEMSEDEMMQKWMEMSTPGEQHAEMAKLAGEWHGVNTHWMYPGAEPESMEQTITYKPILDGRYMIETVKGEMDMGEGHMMPFEGMNIMCYDNMTQKHSFCWVDNMGTGMFIGEGEASRDGKTITYFTDAPNWMTGEPTTYKSVSTINSNDKHTFEMFEKQGDSWFKNMEIVATRASAHTHADGHKHSH